MPWAEKQLMVYCEVMGKQISLYTGWWYIAGLV